MPGCHRNLRRALKHGRNPCWNEAGKGDHKHIHDRQIPYRFTDVATLTPNRWAIVKALTGAGPLGVRELARRVGRDVKGVHTDAQRLVRCGLIDKTAEGRLHLPYDDVRLELVCRAAA